MWSRSHSSRVWAVCSLQRKGCTRILSLVVATHRIFGFVLCMLRFNLHVSHHISTEAVNGSAFVAASFNTRPGKGLASLCVFPGRVLKLVGTGVEPLTVSAVDMVRSCRLNLTHKTKPSGVWWATARDRVCNPLWRWSERLGSPLEEWDLTLITGNR